MNTHTLLTGTHSPNQLTKTETFPLVAPLFARPSLDAVRMADDSIGSRTVSYLETLERFQAMDEGETERDTLARTLAYLQRSSAPEAAGLLDEVRSLWLRGDFQPHMLRAFYADVLTRRRYTDDLRKHCADAAARLAVGKSIRAYFNNASGRFFDSAVADELVRRPSKTLLSHAQTVGAFIYSELARVSARTSAHVHIDCLHYLIRNDLRPWFPECPDIEQFLIRPDLETAQSMLTTVDHGFDMIKVAYLAVRNGWAMQDVGQTPLWLQNADKTFRMIIGSQRTGRKASTPWQTRRPGIMLATQSSGRLAKPSFLWAKNWVEDKQLDFDYLSIFERRALLRGHAIVNGASGSANILGFLHRAIAARDYRFSTSDGLLHTLAFLVYDGGHSIHEVAAVHAVASDIQLNEAGEFIEEAVPSARQKLESYELDYTHLLEANSAERDAFNATLHRALDRTIAATISEAAAPSVITK